MAHKTKRKGIKSIVVVTDESGFYVYHEIDIRAFQFGEIDFKWDDKNSDMIDSLCELAYLNEN